VGSHGEATPHPWTHATCTCIRMCVRASSELWKIARKRGCGEGAHAVGWGGVVRLHVRASRRGLSRPCSCSRHPAVPTTPWCVDQSGARLCGFAIRGHAHTHSTHAHGVARKEVRRGWSGGGLLLLAEGGVGHERHVSKTRMRWLVRTAWCLQSVLTPSLSLTEASVACVCSLSFSHGRNVVMRWRASTVLRCSWACDVRSKQASASA
jgi:hypothetical protein